MKFIDSLTVNLLYKHKNLYLVQFLEKFLFENTKFSADLHVFHLHVFNLAKNLAQEIYFFFLLVFLICVKEWILSIAFLIFLLFFL